MRNEKYAITLIYVRIAEISASLGNRGRGTSSGDINMPEAIQFCSHDALRMHYRQITYEVTLISSDHYKNSSVIVDLTMGQISRSTERISSFWLALVLFFWAYTFSRNKFVNPEAATATDYIRRSRTLSIYLRNYSQSLRTIVIFMRNIRHTL